MKALALHPIVRRVALGAALIAALGASPATAAECAGNDQLTEVQMFGRPQTRFSPQAATTLENLQQQFATYRTDLEKVLADAGWQGDPADLFAAVADGSGVEAVQIQPGDSFRWMAFRKRGQPACVQNIRFAGRKPIAGWRITVESNQQIFTLVVPQVCLNLALADSKPAPKPIPPSCSLAVQQTSCEPRAVSITASGDYASIRLTGPAGAQAAGDNRWSYAPDADGSYRFTAEVTSAEGLTATCSAEIEVDCPDPVCQLNGSYDPDSGQITFDATGGSGQTTLTSLTLPDGTTGSVDAMVGSGDGMWTYDTGATLPRKAGDYTYTVAAETRLSGEVDSCQATVPVTVARQTGWILRGWGASINDSRDGASSTGFRAADNFQNEHRDFNMGGGSGFGLDVEYRFNRRLGIDFGVLTGDLAGRFQIDFDQDCGVVERDIGLTMPFAGLNIHLTPDSRVDVFVGPFVAQVQYDDETFTTLGQSFRANFDDETAIGAVLGIDVPFTKDSRWMATAAVRWLSASADGGPLTVSGNPGTIGQVDLDFEPLIATAGIGVRF